MEHKLFFSAVVVAFTLQGCGGGSSSSSDNTSSPPDPDSLNILVNESVINRQQSTDLLLHFPQQNVSNIQWEQLSGDAVDILAPQSKVLSFTPISAGDYSFQASFTLNGQTQTLLSSITVEEASHPITARLGHAVVEQNKVSLRAELSSEINTDTVTWRQVSGPSVVFNDTIDAPVVYFDAPSVEQDQVVTLEVSAKDNNDNEYTDQVSIIVENGLVIQNNAYFDDRLATVKPFNSDSPYEDVIVDCVYSNSLSSSCQLDRLPLLAQETLSPTIDNIMDRVVVSHPWMGERFKAFLEQQDPHDDFKRLLRATTAVVISYDIRPAFYWAATGAIYLDPDFLWLTPNERDTINEAPDYRSGFGEELQFEMVWRYVKNNDYASENYAWSQRQQRSQQDIVFDLGYLLYHELAHANDYFPSIGWSSLSNGDRVLDEALKQSTQSDILTTSHPLSSQTMRDLAQVRYSGDNATALESSYMPQDIELQFEPDGAVYFYSYSSTREDFAMLFEELMMQSRYGISRDIAITNNPDTGSPATDYIVHWGQRGRLVEPQIYDRLVQATNSVLPEFDAETAIGNLPMVQQLRQGDDWLENLNLNQATQFSLAKELLHKSDESKQQRLRHHRAYYSRPLPKH